VGRIKVKLLLAIVVVATLATTIPALAVTQTNCPSSGACDEETKKAERIIGTSSADRIFADLFNKDSDRVEAKQGDDEIVVRDGDAKDTVDCGKGRDDVVYANRQDDIANNCEHVRYREP
jgi:hypothetical protein